VWTTANSSTHLLATIGDPEGTRTVTSIVGLLVALGLALVMIAVWLWRTTRPDPELLAPLELMGERKWRRADPVAQRRRLDDARPDGAEPLTPSASPPVLDQTFDAGPSATGFDDLDVDDEPEIGRIRSMKSHPLPSAMPTGEATPRQIDRPDVDVFAHDIDPEILAAAEAELQAELDTNANATDAEASATVTGESAPTSADEKVGWPPPGDSEAG